MVDTEQPKILRDVLQAYGVKSIQEVTARTGWKPQQSWMYWHGKKPLGLKVARRLSDAFGIPLLELLSLVPEGPTRVVEDEAKEP